MRENGNDFMEELRGRIFQLTGYDVEPGDPIYPLLAGMKSMLSPMRESIDVLRREQHALWKAFDDRKRKNERLMRILLIILPVVFFISGVFFSKMVL